MGGNDSSKQLSNEQLWTAVERGDEANVRRLLKKWRSRADPNYKSSFRRKKDVSVLMVASVKGCTAIVQLLLESGANVNETDPSGDTPLHIAASKENAGIVQSLIEHKADPDIANENGDTPLHIAASKENAGIVKSLMEHRANPDIQNKDGDIPLHIEGSEGNAGIIKSLLKPKANPDIKERDRVHLTRAALFD